MASRYLSENDCNWRLLNPPLERAASLPGASKKLITRAEAWDYDIYNTDWIGRGSTGDNKYITEDEFISPFVYFDLGGIHPLTYVCNYTYTQGSIPSLYAKFGYFKYDLSTNYIGMSYSVSGDINVINSANYTLRVQPKGNNRNTDITYSGIVNIYMPNGSLVVSSLNIMFHRHTQAEGSTINYESVPILMTNGATSSQGHGLYVIQVVFSAYDTSGNWVDSEIWTGDQPSEGNSTNHQSVVQYYFTNNWPAGTGYNTDEPMAVNFSWWEKTANQNLRITVKEATVIQCDTGTSPNLGRSWYYSRSSANSSWYAPQGGSITCGNYSIGDAMYNTTFNITWSPT